MPRGAHRRVNSSWTRATLLKLLEQQIKLATAEIVKSRSQSWWREILKWLWPKADVGQGLRNSPFRDRERLQPVVELARNLRLTDAVNAYSVAPQSRFNCFASGSDKRRGRGRRGQYFLVPDGEERQPQVQLKFKSVQHLSQLNMGVHSPTVLTMELDPVQLRKQCVQAWRAGTFGVLSLDVLGPLRLALLDAAQEMLSSHDELFLPARRREAGRRIEGVGLHRQW